SRVGWPACMRGCPTAAHPASGAPTVPAPTSPADDAQRRRQLLLAQQAASARAASATAAGRQAETDPSQVATLGLATGSSTPLSHREGEISGAAFLGANLLEIVNHGGRL